ncbi:hypothetical protein IV203_029545 [Nitzschia inconspicua]|uniref:Integrase catalytic domain-containing protein n=1 Tax=Nitzschia inconspicua TaxID=303405 RepID=A0A9K3LQT8_9STRA|nr:hypothetical protein IV203_029545 [Nitzschia inconspicua]
MPTPPPSMKEPNQWRPPSIITSAQPTWPHRGNAETPSSLLHRHNQRPPRPNSEKPAIHQTKCPPPPTTDDTDEFLPTADPPNYRTHHCFAAAFEPTGKIYSDLTGKFIAPSSTGNNYILVVYDINSNAILTIPMKNRSQQSHTDAFCLAHQRLVRAGLRPRLQLLDNECYTMLKTFMHDQDLDFQLVPPYLHRRNAAKRAIRTFKNHFIAGLCSTDPAFPIHLWDQLLPQAELTLNLLRGSRLNPKLSAWAQLHGTDDYNRTPLAPPQFFPKSVALPLATPSDLIHASLQDIINILKKPTSLSAPCLSTSNRHALEQLADIFSPNSPTPLRVATKAPPSPGPSPPGTPRHSNLQPVHASLLRVPTKDLPPLPNLPDPVPASPRAAGPTDVTTAPSDATFPNLTGPAARNRQRRTPKKSAMTSRKQPTAPKKKISPHPNPHVTRQTTGALPQPSHLASHAATTSFEKLLLDAAVPVTYHMALHSNAFNPDTGKIANAPKRKTHTVSSGRPVATLLITPTTPVPRLLTSSPSKL